VDPDRLDALEQDFKHVEAQLADPAVIADQARYTEVARRYRELEPVAAAAGALRVAREELADARELAGESTGDDRDFYREEATRAEATIERLEQELQVLLLPPDPNAGRGVIVEIRGAEGGEEANLFARDLFRMYEGFAGRQGWKLEVLSSTDSQLGGFDEVTFVLHGDGAWTRMKFEGGPHRVQRVPVTESQGRIHTSSATVTVLPEADEVDVQIDDKDLNIDVYRSSGPGGQSVNTTDSAVRITHLPTGEVVSMQDQKSQLQNKAKALQVLRSRLLQRAQDEAAAQASDARRSQTGGGGRSEKIRTYNYKENRVTDHRIGLTIHKLDRVLAGELDEVSDALVADDQARALARADVR
jgi:peptide chain release factor 1